MAFAIRVKSNPDDRHYFFENEFATVESFQPVVDHCVNQRRIDLFESTLITVRTDTLSNFCKDFFFPTLINQALKTDDVALKIFMVAFCFCLDVCTFPVRLFTLIPRYLSNSQCPREEHPLHKYLLAQGAAAERLAVDHLYLELEWSEGGVGFPAEFVTDENRVSLGGTFNFIQLPQYETLITNEYSRFGKPADLAEIALLD